MSDRSCIVEDTDAGGMTLVRRSTRWDWLTAGLLMVVIGLIAVPMLRFWVVQTGDFGTHSIFAEQMRQADAITVPHFTYHAVLIGVQNVVEWFGLGPKAYNNADLTHVVFSPQNNPALFADVSLHYALASIITCMIFTALLGVILWLVLRWGFMRFSWGRGWPGRILAAALALGMLLAAPVALLVSLDERMYLGYIGINVWHNPTMLALKPLAVLSFFYAAALFKDPPAIDEAAAERSGFVTSALFILGGATVTVLGTLAKPNYALCLLPGVAIFVPWAWYRRMTIRWTPLLLGLVLPALAVLLWQYTFTYRTSDAGKNSIIFAPLMAMLAVSPKYLFGKFILSIVFPGLVWLLFLRGVWTDGRMVLAWLVFYCSALWAYLAAESARPGHGNFGWGSQMALFILILESIRFLLRSGVPGARSEKSGGVAPKRAWWPIVICAVAFLAHVGYGIAYNMRILNMPFTNKPGWW